MRNQPQQLLRTDKVEALCELRTLSVVADALDEHMGLLRIADVEGFDVLTLRARLHKFPVCWCVCLSLPTPRPLFQNLLWEEQGSKKIIGALKINQLIKLTRVFKFARSRANPRSSCG